MKSPVEHKVCFDENGDIIDILGGGVFLRILPKNG